MSSKIKVIEKNPGQKIPWKQNGTKLTFGDDELMINVAKYQKDWNTQIDICGDLNGNLVIGIGEGRYYAAQVDIPAIKYKDPEPVKSEKTETIKEVEEPVALSETGEDETGETMTEVKADEITSPAEFEESRGSMQTQTTPPEPIPLEMSDVTLTLWNIDGLRN